MTRDIVLALSEADAELGRLDGLAHSLPDPEILISPFLRREAVLSSRIEGTQTTYQDLVLFEAADSSGKPGSDTVEVANYAVALRYGVERVAQIPMGRRLVLEMHSLLMAGTDESKTRRGQFRDRQVYIAPAGSTIAESRYVPPPAIEVEPLIDNLATYFSAPDNLPLLVRLAITHYQFEAIHPFIDGNGRLGRLLIVLILCQERRLLAPMLYLSAYFERRRQQYNELMFDVSCEGAWRPWILFFLEGVATQAKDAIARMRQLQDLRQAYHDRLGAARAPQASHKLVDALFRLPVLTNDIARARTGFSWPAANENLQRLLDNRIVIRLQRRRKHYFIASEIIEILDRASATEG